MYMWNMSKKPDEAEENRIRKVVEDCGNEEGNHIFYMAYDTSSARKSNKRNTWGLGWVKSNPPELQFGVFTGKPKYDHHGQIEKKFIHKIETLDGKGNVLHACNVSEWTRDLSDGRTYLKRVNSRKEQTSQASRRSKRSSMSNGPTTSLRVSFGSSPLREKAVDNARKKDEHILNVRGKDFYEGPFKVGGDSPSNYVHVTPVTNGVEHEATLEFVDVSPKVEKTKKIKEYATKDNIPAPRRTVGQARAYKDKLGKTYFWNENTGQFWYKREEDRDEYWLTHAREYWYIPYANSRSEKYDEYWGNDKFDKWMEKEGRKHKAWEVKNQRYELKMQDEQDRREKRKRDAVMLDPREGDYRGEWEEKLDPREEKIALEIIEEETSEEVTIEEEETNEEEETKGREKEDNDAYWDKGDGNWDNGSTGRANWWKDDDGYWKDEGGMWKDDGYWGKYSGEERDGYRWTSKKDACWGKESGNSCSWKGDYRGEWGNDHSWEKWDTTHEDWWTSSKVNHDEDLSGDKQNEWWTSKDKNNDDDDDDDHHHHHHHSWEKNEGKDLKTPKEDRGKKLRKKFKKGKPVIGAPVWKEKPIVTIIGAPRKQKPVPVGSPIGSPAPSVTREPGLPRSPLPPYPVLSPEKSSLGKMRTTPKKKKLSPVGGTTTSSSSSKCSKKKSPPHPAELRGSLVTVSSISMEQARVSWQHDDAWGGGQSSNKRTLALGEANKKNSHDDLPPVLSVTGFLGRFLVFNGAYHKFADRLWSNRVVYRKISDRTAVLYYYNGGPTRDKEKYRGWWLSENINSRTHIAMVNSTALYPPVSGWKTPHVDQQGNRILNNLSPVNELVKVEVHERPWEAGFLQIAFQVQLPQQVHPYFPTANSWAPTFNTSWNSSVMNK